MKVFGIAGHSGMGKTTLLERLVPAITARGMVVSLVKHSPKDIEIDRPGKDSYRLRESGCTEVLLMGNQRWALMHELRGAPEPTLDYLLDRLQACDLVLIEGFKHGHFPKLEVWRAAVGKETLWPDWPGILAIASDRPPTSAAQIAVTPGLSHLDLADTASITEFVLAHAQFRPQGV
jgi:molybdopterin-guanine dinucleotide biosynthesis protein B